MKPGERRLVIILGVLIFVVLNVILVNFFMKKQKVREAKKLVYAGQKMENEVILQNKTLWDTRENWIQEVAHRHETSEVAQIKFLEVIEGAGLVNAVEMARPQIRPKNNDDYTALQEVTAEVLLTGDLNAILGFAYDLEDPEQLTSVRQIDMNPPTKEGDPFKAKVKVTRFYKFSDPVEEEDLADTTTEAPPEG